MALEKKALQVIEPFSNTVGKVENAYIIIPPADKNSTYSKQNKMKWKGWFYFWPLILTNNKTLLAKQ